MTQKVETSRSLNELPEDGHKLMQKHVAAVINKTILCYSLVFNIV